jgi:hypothetical protein
MVCHSAFHCLWYPIQLGPLPSQLCHGLSTSPHQDGHVHGASHRYSYQAREFQRSRPQATCQHLRAKQAGCVWNSYLVTKLWEINFKQSLIDDCVFYWDDVILIVYVKDGIFLGSLDQQLHDIIIELRNLKLSIEDQGHPADYVGVSIKKLKNSVIELTQQALLNSIISDMALGDSKVKAVLAKVSKILHAHLDKPLFLLNFGYQSIIGKLNYLAQNNEARYCLLDSPTHQVLIQPKRTSWGSSPLYDLLLEEDSRLKNLFKA